jgi:hypothetical protein
MRTMGSAGDGLSQVESIWVNGLVPGEHSARRVSQEPFALAANAANEPLRINGSAGVAASDEWAAAVGRCVLAFARVEHAATLLIRQCTSDALGRKMARLDLVRRLACLDKLLRGGGLTMPEARRWRQVHKKINALQARYRTILAFGTPLPGPIEFTGDSVIVRASHSRGPRSDGLLTLPQIELAAEDIGATRVQFVQTVTAILARLLAEHRLPLSTSVAMPGAAPKPASANRRRAGVPRSPGNAQAPGSRSRGGQIV